MTDEYVGAYVLWLFPNLGLSETESSWSTFHVQPLAPDKTKVIVRSKTEDMSNWEYYKQGMKSYATWSKKTKYGKTSTTDPDDPMASGDFMAEDIYACEQQQKSLSTPLFSIGATAQFGESTVREFQGIIKRWMGLCTL